MPQEVQHPAFPVPAHSSIKLWRYLDWFKFEWLVREQRLFMPNAAHLGDPLEGTQPLGDATWWDRLAAAAKTDAERETIQHNKHLILKFATAFRTGYYISCWHMNERENPLMWKQYTRSPKAVAVQTTFARLRTALPLFVGIGMVRYINFTVDRLPTLNMFEYITHKNQCFSSEAELRAVAMHPVVEGLDQQQFREQHFQLEENPAVRVYAPPVRISELIEQVRLHPDSPGEFARSVEALCADIGLTAPLASALVKEAP